MNNIINFNFHSSQVRIIDIDGEPFFALKDISIILGISNNRELKNRLDARGVISTDILTKGGIQKTDFINEKNLYKCIFRSKRKEAQNFQDWIFGEVLPQIRKTGSFSINNTLKLDSLSKHTTREAQLKNSKGINALQFALGGVEAVKLYNRDNCQQVTGMSTTQIKSLGKKIGLKSKFTQSAKEVCRNVPELQAKACTMSLNDEIITINPKIKLPQLSEIDKKANELHQMLLDQGIKNYLV